jgi:crossover junction endodeoxyribonuclease RuvC
VVLEGPYLVLGIDPGYSGCVVSLHRETGEVDGLINLSETPHDIAEFVRARALSIDKAYLEKVGAMPRQGVSSTFKFGTSYGFCLGLLTSLLVPFEEVTPAKWQQVMKCRSGGDKKITKAAAQRLFPRMKVTHKNADALLIAEYGRRVG